MGELHISDGDVEKCKDQCNKSDRCKLFNYSKSRKTCWFKDVTHDQGIGEWQSDDDFDVYEKGELI